MDWNEVARNFVFTPHSNWTLIWHLLLFQTGSRFYVVINVDNNINIDNDTGIDVMFQMGANKRTKHHKNKTNWTLRILHLSPLKESFDFVQGQVKVPAMVLYLDWASLISKYTVSCASVEVVMKMTLDPVSYTHLTLPTIYSV